MAAREYWSTFKKLILNKCDWSGRKPRSDDIANRLLDIGYHYLVEEITKIFDEINLPYELGLLHIAQSKSAKPLVYDFMEWLRPIVVDQTLLVLIRKKKKKFEKVAPIDIAIFINMLKKQLNKLFFNKNLGYCIKLEFWIKINALNILSAINHKTYPKWIFPSLRHESRCKKQKTPDKNMLEPKTKI